MAITKINHAISQSVHGFPRSHQADTITGRWTPNTDLYTHELGLVIKVELAGMKSDSLEITVEGQRIRINGERPDCCRSPQCSFLMMEISYGPFETVLDLPAGYDLAQAKALYQNGFLRIDVPVAVQPKVTSKKVPISQIS
jgi:HSP20 family protein